MDNKKTSFLDKLGMGAAGICLVHCLILPVLISSVPFFAFMSFMHDPIAEMALIIFAILNAVFAVTSGFKKHQNYIVPALLFSGVVMLSLFFVAEKFIHSHEYLITIGAFLIGIGHILNFKLCKNCEKCTIKYE